MCVQSLANSLPVPSAPPALNLVSTQSQTHSPTEPAPQFTFCPSWTQRANRLMQIVRIQGHHVGECAGQAVLGTQRNLQISSSYLSLDGNCLVSITDQHKMIFGLALFFLSYEFMHWLLLLDFQLDGKHYGNRHQFCSCISMMYFY